MFTKMIKSLMAAIFTIIIAVVNVYADTADLPLVKTPIRFAIIGDRTGQNVAGIYEEIVAEVEQLKPDFVMTVGDAIEGYTEDTVILDSQWDEYLKIVKPLSMPIYFTPGNHDITSDAALKPFEQKIGKPFYSFNVRNYHFVVLDVSRWNAGTQLPKEQLDWLTADLAKHRDAAQTLVFFHKPFWYNSVVLNQPDTLHTLFVANGVDAVFNGHLHSYFTARLDGILYTAVGSSGGIIDAMPSNLDYHLTWVTLDDKGITIAPIKKGGVEPWDVVTASELRLTEKITRQSVKFVEAVPVGENLKIAETTGQLEIENLADQILNDTIRWQIPEGWSIKPAIEPISIMPKAKKQITFQVQSASDLYPLPMLTLKLPYNIGKSIPISKNLRISRTAIAQLATKQPVIDGKLDDNCWQNPIVKLLPDEATSPSVDSTWFYFAYDKDNLYWAAHCLDLNMDSLQAKAKQPDSRVSADDCIGLIIQPNCQIDTAYQIYINPLGTVLDQKIFLGSLGYYTGRKSWDGIYTIKAKRGERYWDIEACIPLAQFKATGNSGQILGINLMRKQKRLNATADWQVPFDYDPKTYGILRLK